MRALLQLLLAIVLLLLLGILSWLFVLYMEWPAWGAFAVFFGVLGALLGIKAIRRFWLISRTKSKLLATQSAAVKIKTTKDGFSLSLSKKWKDVIEMLKQSQLKRFGNPLYVLPWYMVIGESGAGKTTAITRSRLSSMLRQTAESKQIVQTTNCDWWFFNHAIVLDTAGRYVSPNGDEQDLQEWHYLLDLFTKYRPGEGLNGLVVVVSADALLSGDASLLETQGRTLRERIDLLMRMFEKRFPIYVMVTKADRIYGFTQWAENLSDAESQEAMGYLHQTAEGIPDEREFVTHAVSTIRDRLVNLRLDMAMRGVSMTPEMLMLPSEIDRIQEGLQIFLTAVFGENPYLEHPYLRGLFLTSAKQEHALPSRISALTAELADQSTHAQTGQKGIFIHDVFARILPKERYVFLAGRIVSRWRSVTKNMALTAWLFACFSAAVFLFVSYQSTASTIERLQNRLPPEFKVAVSHDDTSPKSAPEKYQKQIADLSTLLLVVNLLLEEGSDWKTSWLAFSPDVHRLESSLEQAFVRRFRAIQQGSSGVNQVAKSLMQGTDPVKKAYAILGSIRYVNMVQARIAGADYTKIIAMPQVPTHTTAFNPSIDKYLQTNLKDLIAAAIAWSDPTDPYLSDSLQKTQALISQTAFQNRDMPWLVQWADSIEDVAPIKTSDFWRRDVIVNASPDIPAGLTLAGSQRIEGFLGELQSALGDSETFKTQVASFRPWYLDLRFEAWRKFALGFTGGDNVIGIEPAWKGVVSTLGTAQSPFYLFFDKLNSEFANLSQQESPAWLKFARYFYNLDTQAQKSVPLKGAMNIVSAFHSVAGGIMRPRENPGHVSLVGAVRAATKDIKTYEGFLKSLKEATVAAVGGANTNFQMAQNYFAGAGEGDSAKPSVLRSLDQQLREFRKESEYQGAQDEAFWQIVYGPVKFLTTYVLEQASCQVQSDWDTSVIWKSQLAINPKEASAQLFGDKGTVWAFVDGPNEYFINRKGGAFSAVSYEGYKMPYSIGFIDFLNRAVTSRVSELVKQTRAGAADKKTAKLSLAAYPLSVNPTAKIKPYSATLVMQCADAVVQLSNLNMQASDSFVWSPDQCGETTLEIEIENMTLTKRYPGPLGLPTLLEEFQDGAKVFTPRDFPAASDRLDELDVTEITVRYDFTGKEDVLRLAQDYRYLLEQTTPSTQSALSRMEISVPARAGRCWTSIEEPEAPLTLPKYIAKQAERKANPPPPPPEPKLPPIEPLKPAPTKEIVIKKGDTLFSIGRQYKVDPGILKALNNLTSDKILAGQKLLVPIWANQ